MSNATKEQVIEGLTKVLANSYLLYLKTHNYHWNVTGAHFRSLHLLFEEQYTDLATAIDEIAEQIRILGAYAPGSFAEYSKLAVVKEATKKDRTWDEMVKDLAGDQQKLLDIISETLEAASAVGLEATVDLMVQRTQVHSKNKWFLDSFVG